MKTVNIDLGVDNIKDLSHNTIVVSMIEQGEQGLQGPAGPKGEQGTQGERGPIGPQGETGPKGEKGDVGPAGPAGMNGKDFKYEDFTKEQLAALKGPKGEQGTQGERGPIGPQGETGPKGEKGDVGPAGPAGMNGKDFKYEDFTKEQLAALKGPKGEQGTQGERGLQGPPGKDGERGPAGERGPQGLQGPAGPKGEGADIDLSEYVKKSDLRPEARYITMTAVIDQNNPDPLACITYEDDAKGMSKGSPEWDKFFGTKLVLFKDGKEVRELKDDELNNLSPDDGDVMAKFSRKGLNIKTVDNKVYVSMTDNPNNSDYGYYAHSRGEEAIDAFYLGAYLGYEENGKLRSIKGVMPTGNKAIGDFRTIAQANGKGYEQLAFYQWTFLQAMYVLKYGNLDSQTALGKGLTGGSEHKNTGYTNGKGVNYGTNSDVEQMRFQYLEDMWGNKVQWLDGAMTGENGIMKTNTDGFNNTANNYKSHSLGINEDIGGYTSSIQGSNELGFVPKTANGSDSTYYSDYAYVPGSVAAYVACVGGYFGYASGAGAFYVFFGSGVDNADDVIGARLMFL